VAENTRDMYGQYSSTDHFFLWACVINEAVRVPAKMNMYCIPNVLKNIYIKTKLINNDLITS